MGFSGWRTLIPLQFMCVGPVTATLLERSMATMSVPRYTPTHNKLLMSSETFLPRCPHFSSPTCSSFHLSHLQLGGQCQCKAAVTGRHCADCLPGWYSLQASDPKGCIRCNCSDIGVINTSTGGVPGCNQHTGQCRCKPHVTGRQSTDTP